MHFGQSIKINFKLTKLKGDFDFVGIELPTDIKYLYKVVEELHCETPWIMSAF